MVESIPSDISIAFARHICKALSTPRIMLDMVLGLVPAVVVAGVYFRLHGLLIAMTNTALSGRIEQNKAAKLNDLTKALLPGAEIFQPVEADIQVDLPDGSKERARVFEVLSGDQQRIGWSFSARGAGFAGPIELVLAADKDFQKIMGFDVLASSETPGFGDQIKSDYYRKQYVNAPAEQLSLVKTGAPARADAQIVAITGATVSSQAVVDIVNRFLTQIKSQMQEKGLFDNVRQ